MNRQVKRKKINRDPTKNEEKVNEKVSKTKEGEASLNNSNRYSMINLTIMDSTDRKISNLRNRVSQENISEDWSRKRLMTTIHWNSIEAHLIWTSIWQLLEMSS